MKDVILLRFGEIYLKGKNKGFFETTLLKNIKKTIREYDCKVQKISGRYLISDFDQMDGVSIISKLKNIFGLTSLSVAKEFDTSKQAIETFMSNFQTSASTFRVTVKRADKTFPVASNEYEKLLGELVLNNNPKLKVKLKKPELELVVEIRENKKTYVLTDIIPCVGGMPIGTAGKGLVLLSGGIDSPVAAYMMAKRGLDIIGLHFHSFPYTSVQAKEKVCKLAKILTDYTGQIKLICCPFTEIQEEIHKNCSPEFMITIMRRIMMRIAKIVCDKFGAKAIITGESLAQVASQTLESINVTNDAQSSYPVFRPCIGMDKTEIIDISQKIGTYETSILPYEDCCTVFLPKNPVIKPHLDRVIREESKLKIDELINKAINNLEIIEI